MSDIKRLRVAQQAPRRWYNSNDESWGWSFGTIAFDHGAKMTRFGMVDEAEAAMLVERLGMRLNLAFDLGAEALPADASPWITLEVTGAKLKRGDVSAIIGGEA